MFEYSAEEFYKVEQGDLEYVRNYVLFLNQQGLNPFEATCELGMFSNINLLTAAAMTNQLHIVEWLIENGFNSESQIQKAYEFAVGYKNHSVAISLKIAAKKNIERSACNSQPMDEDPFDNEQTMDCNKTHLIKYKSQKRSMPNDEMEIDDVEMDCFEITNRNKKYRTSIG